MTQMRLRCSHVKETSRLPSLSFSGYIVHLCIATLCFSTERAFSALSPISERRYFVSGWSFMELLPAQYWIFVSMWHCFSRLESTKRIWWKKAKDEWRHPIAKLMSAAIWKCTEFIKRIETQMWLLRFASQFYSSWCSHISVLFSISFHLSFTGGTRLTPSVPPYPPLLMTSCPHSIFLHLLSIFIFNLHF